MELFQHTPQFSLDEAGALVEKLYGIQAELKVLPSERDQNFRLTDPATGAAYVFKIANGLEEAAFLEAQHALWRHVADQGIDYCPQLRPALAGGEMVSVAGPAGATYLARLVTFLPGTPLANARRQTPALWHDLGHKLGRLDGALAGFDHAAAHREFHWDLAAGPDVVAKHRHLIADPELGVLVDQLMTAFEQHTVPLLPRLRRSVIHSDANDHNVVVGGGTDLDSRDQTVTGLIDFGDMVHSYTVGNLAIAAAYLMLDHDDPVAVAAEAARGYHAAFPLSDDELEALFGLITLRLCTSVCLAAVQQAARPDDPYLAISQAPIRRTLPRLAEIPYGMATARLRAACGLEPVRQSPEVVRFLQTQQFAPILGRDLAAEKTISLDLSIGSPLLPGDVAAIAEPEFSERVFGLMAAAGVTVSIGRYNEPRLIYSEPMFATGPGPFDERRTIHIAIDLFAEAGTPIYAPLAGTIHEFGFHNQPQDYGGMITLRHETDTGTPFYTLYGHLSKASLAGLEDGLAIPAGSELARMGPPSENGGWPPHLHFQIIVDMLDVRGGFAGVGLASQRDVWQSLCPDPNLILRLPPDRQHACQNNYEQTFAKRQARLGPNLSLGYRQPLKIERGFGQYLWDHQGQKYLDGYNNVPHVGHCHPHVVAAGQRQMAVLNTNTRYLHDFLNEYAERLCATLPDGLDVCFFVNSASEANELALRLARAYTGHKNLIVNEGAYHGHTTGLIDISPYKHDGPGGQGAPAWVHTAPVADVYRGQYRADDPLAAQKYADEVGQIVARLQAAGEGLSGFIAESCPSVGGQIILPAGYLAAVYDHVRAAGGLTIADEVQTGYGRIGTHFYAFEAQGVVPDMVVLGKPIGNGHPIGALVTSRAIADAFANGMEFFSTFGGNTVSCAIGLAVLDVLAAEPLQENARQVGDRMLAGLRVLQEKYPIIGDVRGSGLFLGIELVNDRETLAPAADEASFIVNELARQRILIGTDGPLHNVLKIRPPMPFDAANGDFLVATLDRILATLPG
ncbi:MAG: aminotransferase class III-fold pyridoxal phosphate-dependent enzyme [Ardenticatenales bacterium]|nr:aminotransferase class III-fold pyridoxal phosphate-dependent enzyme [Ardenticatenales bacterium]